MRAAWAIVVALAACGGSDDPKWSATCVPDPATFGLSCSVQNLGKKAGRACLTVKLNPEGRLPVYGRRTCTAIVEPQQSVTIQPIIQDNIGFCMDGAQWVCPIEIVETSRTLGENIPGEAKAGS